MQFGLLYEMQRPFEGKNIDWNSLYKETLEQCALADKVGFDNLWFVEHHFLTGFSGSPCPEVMFGALSQLTKRIRIGLGVSILPYHHPVRVAERVAMVDQLTNGRVEVGTGRSNAYEQTGLGVDPGIPAPCGKSQSPCCRRFGSRRSFPGKGNSGRCRRATCCPNLSKNPIPGCIWPARRLRASRSRPRKASASCPPPLTPPPSSPSTSKSIGKPSSMPSPWGPCQQVLGKQRPRPLRREQPGGA